MRSGDLRVHSMRLVKGVSSSRSENRLMDIQGAAWRSLRAAGGGRRGGFGSRNIMRIKELDRARRTVVGGFEQGVVEDSRLGWVGG